MNRQKRLMIILKKGFGEANIPATQQPPEKFSAPSSPLPSAMKIPEDPRCSGEAATAQLQPPQISQRTSEGGKANASGLRRDDLETAGGSRLPVF